jgi:phospholipid/cholesterol/gamma-HCH transport system permease protein
MLKKTVRLDFLASIGKYVRLFVEVAEASIRRPPTWALLREQLYNIGVLSLTVVAITGFSTGFVLAAQSFYQLSSKGLASITGIMVAKSMITELGPILTAFMVTGRVGSSMCAELGTMNVTEQIDALKSMAVNPHRYLVAPRFIAGVIMMPLLTLFCIAMGIYGGYLVSVYLFGMAPSSYFDPMPQHITLFDLFTGVFKAVCFGITFVTVCCYTGMRARGGAAGVGIAITKSVVISYILILISDFFLTVMLNSIYQELKTDWF